MRNSLDLVQAQLIELSQQEILEIQGGSAIPRALLKKLIDGAMGGIVISVAENFGDFRKGLIDGWNTTYNP